MTFGSGRVGAEHFKDSGIKSGRSATIFFIWENHMIKEFGHTELHKRLGSCCALALVRTSMWTTICNKHPRFSRRTFECYNARIAPSNTGQTTLFPGNCLFNSLFRCRAPTIIQKIRRSTSQICSTHRGTSTRHELVGAMA